MAFGFASNPAGGNIPAELGPELPDVFAEEVGFKGVSGDSNIRLLPTPWPEDALPSPTSSLLAVAPTKGVVVGAGPDSLIIASSDAIRAAISAPTEGKVKTKPFQPQATIPLPARPTHIAFTSGESALVVATENGSQLFVYDIASLTAGNAQPALSIPANYTTLRALAPNPAPSDDTHSSLVALVTSNGELQIADLKAGTQVLRQGVSSVCWSNKGKQLVAGLADGTASQMTPDGTQKAVIPRPSDLEGDCHVSSIAWLENDIFLMVFTPNAAEDDMGQVPSSSYYVITRKKQAPFQIRKLPELCSPFGFNRAPAYQFMARLRDYKPYLKDVLIVSSTASTDVGMVTRSDQPLASNDAAKETVGLFTMTEVNDDTKRASLPLKESGDETSVIGLGIDLSSKDIVIAPIQGEDIAESATPLPNLVLLNHDGILSSWWFVYSESIRQKLPYHGLASAGASEPQQTQALQQTPAPAAPAQPAKQPAFGQSAFGSPSAMGGTSPFGKPSTAPAFGSPSTLGMRQQSALGAPSFGSPSFGTPSAIGQSKPQFGQSGFGSIGAKPGFGQPSTPGQGVSASPFGASAASGGGFGSFANSATSGGFAGLASQKPAESAFGKPSENPFGKPASDNPFGKPSGGSVFGTQNTSSSFSTQKTEESKSVFGMGSTGFKLESSFKGDGTAINDGPKPEKPSGGLFGLGGSLDDMVSTPNKASPPAENMDDMDDEPAASQEKLETKQPAPGLFGAPSKIETSAPSSLFGSKPPPQNPFGAQPSPFGAQPSTKSPFSLFGNTTAEKPASASFSPPSEKTAVPSPTIKTEPSTDIESTPISTHMEAPLPPDSTSRAVYGPGDTSASSNVSKSSIDDAPLPPDFTSFPKKLQKESEGEPPLPPDFTTKPTSKESGGEPPLPPDFTTKAPSKSVTEDAPLPPDFTQKPKKDEADEVSIPPAPTESNQADEVSEEPGQLSDGSDADESDFTDSGEDITNDISQPDEDKQVTQETPKITPESSFGAEPSDKSPFGGLFSRVSQANQAQQQPRQLFGEITKPVFHPAPRNQDSPRSPSPVRSSAHKIQFKPKAQQPGSALAARKASLGESARRELQLKRASAQALQEQAHIQAQAQREEESLSLSDDEDERLHADLARPLEPVPTLDPFLPHQDYTGETSKPGIPGQIEKLYRDINSMVDTLGINARSLSSFLLYQQQDKDSDWIKTLEGDQPADIQDKELRLAQVEKLDDAVMLLAAILEQQRVQGVEEKLKTCQELLSKDILTLRGQCASIRKTLDAHTDASAIVSAPLSAEQATLQQDVRSASTDIQAKLADLESAVSLLRARIVEAPRSDAASRASAKRPTVEAVTSTIATMMNMAENKSGDIDVLEAQLKRLGIDTTATPSSREGSPFNTPRKALGILPTTPGSRGSVEPGPSAYHTPESATRGINFRSSLNGSARASRLRSVETGADLVSKEESAQWKARTQRRQQIVGGLKQAIQQKKSKVRGVDDL